MPEILLFLDALVCGCALVLVTLWFGLCAVSQWALRPFRPAGKLLFRAYAGVLRWINL